MRDDFSLVYHLVYWVYGVHQRRLCGCACSRRQYGLGMRMADDGDSCGVEIFVFDGVVAEVGDGARGIEGVIEGVPGLVLELAVVLAQADAYFAVCPSGAHQ